MLRVNTLTDMHLPRMHIHYSVCICTRYYVRNIRAKTKNVLPMYLGHHTWMPASGRLTEKLTDMHFPCMYIHYHVCTCKQNYVYYVHNICTKLNKSHASRMLTPTVPRATRAGPQTMVGTVLASETSRLLLELKSKHGIGPFAPPPKVCTHKSQYNCVRTCIYVAHANVQRERARSHAIV